MIEFLGMVRGKTDRIYLNLCSQLRALAPDLVKLPTEKTEETEPANLIRVHVKTEGKTDWKHMKCAKDRLLELGNEFGCDIEFDEFEDVRGDSDLLKLCKSQAKTSNDKPIIFIFDRDNLDSIKEAVDDSTGYKNWGNNVYSLAIPIPTHRRDNPNISIEFYYKDEELHRQDKYGRRLFLSNEFQYSGQHKTLQAFCHEKKRIKNPNISIIDSEVYSIVGSEAYDDNGDEIGKSIALSKNDFANYILNQEEGFHDFDITEFMNIFKTIGKIVKSQ